MQHRGGMQPRDMLKFRKAYNMTQGELAALLGVERTTIYRWETGRQGIPAYIGYACYYIALRATMPLVEPSMKG